MQFIRWLIASAHAYRPCWSRQGHDLRITIAELEFGRIRDDWPDHRRHAQRLEDLTLNTHTPQPVVITEPEALDLLAEVVTIIDMILVIDYAPRPVTLYHQHRDAFDRYSLEHDFVVEVFDADHLNASFLDEALMARAEQAFVEQRARRKKSPSVRVG
ncbi:MAG: hypothetical protein AAFV53_08685 [Myxococcota bacterium]